jgi:hypothetical protein
VSQIEKLATHNRQLIWQSTAGPIRLMHMSLDHLKAASAALEHSIRINKCYPPLHPRRRHETHREYQLMNMQAEINWRNRNGH